MIHGGPQDDEVLALGGSNIITGGGGTNVLLAGQGHNFVFGGTGQNAVAVGGGGNYFSPGSGQAVVLDNPSTDFVFNARPSQVTVRPLATTTAPPQNSGTTTSQPVSVVPTTPAPGNANTGGLTGTTQPASPLTSPVILTTPTYQPSNNLYSSYGNLNINYFLYEKEQAQTQFNKANQIQQNNIDDFYNFQDSSYNLEFYSEEGGSGYNGGQTA